MDIKISPNDKREFRFIKLENKIRALLICDSETTKSSAAMQVEVGSALNPDEYPGLAHF
jgi:secreted Zn-dependent insulinase-like peptidase